MGGRLHHEDLLQPNLCHTAPDLFFDHSSPANDSH